MELVSAAGLLHGQLMEIQRGKMPDQALLEKLVQQIAGSGNGGDPSDDELQELLELAMAEPGEPPNWRLSKLSGPNSTYRTGSGPLGGSVPRTASLIL